MINLNKFREKMDPILAVQYKGDNIEECIELFLYIGSLDVEVFTNNNAVLFDSIDFGYLRVPINGWLVADNSNSIRVYTDKKFSKRFESY